MALKASLPKKTRTRSSCIILSTQLSTVTSEIDGYVWSTVSLFFGHSFRIFHDLIAYLQTQLLSRSSLHRPVR